jgi:hypothetical protein
VRTFDELIRTALVDIAERAEPVDLADAALHDITQRTRVLALGAVATATVTLGVALLVGFVAGQDAPQGRFQPNGVVPGQSGGGGSPSGCDTAQPAPTPGCPTPQADATLAASEGPSTGPSGSASPSGSATPTPTDGTTAGTDNGPGNRPHPKPSKPGRIR